jgi:hypothetical protein
MLLMHVVFQCLSLKDRVCICTASHQANDLPDGSTVRSALRSAAEKPLLTFRPTRRSERRNEADQAVGVDALLSLASVGRDDSGPADGDHALAGSCTVVIKSAACLMCTSVESAFTS